LEIAAQLGGAVAGVGAAFVGVAVVGIAGDHHGLDGAPIAVQVLADEVQGAKAGGSVGADGLDLAVALPGLLVVERRAHLVSVVDGVGHGEHGLVHGDEENALAPLGVAQVLDEQVEGVCCAAQ
jgi:hypothetical protein